MKDAGISASCFREIKDAVIFWTSKYDFEKEKGYKEKDD